MKKRFLALAMAAAMMFGLVACGNSGGSSAATGSTPAGDSSATVAPSDVSTPEEDSSTPDETGSEAVELWVVRHGETMFNVKSLVQGWSDAPLTENGVASSGYVGAGLKDAGVDFVAAYTSDMTRCIETSAYLLEGMGSSLAAQPDKRFREMNFGVWEGAPTAELREEYPNMYDYENFEGFEGGEDWSAFTARLMEGLSEVGAAHEGTGGKVLVTAHGAVQICLMFALSEEDFVPSGSAVPNNGVMVLTYQDGEIALQSAPTASYLEKGMELAGVEPASAAH